MKCTLVGLPKLGDKILYRLEDYGGLFARLVFELPENFTSLLEWIDFIVPESLERYVSSVEKIVLDDFFGFRGRAYGLITLFSEVEDFRELLRGRITIFTSESQPFEYLFEDGDDCILDFIYSFSSHYPSRFRPEYRHPDFKFFDDGYLAYNNILGSIDRKVSIQLEMGGDFDVYLYPPNLLGGRVDPSLFFPEFSESFEVLDRGDEYIKWYLEVLRGFNGRGIHVFPLMFNEGLSFKGGYIVLDGKPRYHDDLRLELDRLTIDLAWELDGVKPSLSFKRFRSFVKFSGRKYLVNIGFEDYPPPPSHRFVEFRIGSKVVWSSPSAEGLLGLKLV